MKSLSLKTKIALVLLLCLFSTYAISSEKISIKDKALKTLMSKATSNKTVDIIVLLKTPKSTRSLGNDTLSAAAAKLSSIKKAQNIFSKKISISSARIGPKFKNIPGMALTVDAATLKFIANDPNVLSISEDKIRYPLLADSIPLIKADKAHAKGYGGAGQVVAIIDSGVDYTHPFLSGKVISGACYSDNLCPGGGTSEIGVSAGANCDTNIVSNCSHGTHVAGIVAGSHSSGVTGVAPDAKLIAIQAASYFTDPSTGRYKIGFNDRNIILGLDRVYTLKDTYNIAAVNMSIGGGGPYYNYCDGETYARPYKMLIDKLRDAGIATIIASGNERQPGNGFNQGVSFSACISSAITVGATSKTDIEASYSNSSANILDLLAPGGDGGGIYSSIPNGEYEPQQGTSMAAPHVAGAWAVLKSKSLSASVDTIESVLKTTGKAVPIAAGGTKPRIDLEAALDQLGGGGKPGTATLISPSGTISDSTPTYTWHAVSNATYYNLWVNDATGKKIEQWYTAEKAGCSGGTGTCSVTPSTVLTNGSGKWWIQTWNTAGYGPWSSGKAFNLDTSSGGKPGSATLISPSGTISDSTPTYTWRAVSNATYYNLWVNDATGKKIEQWYTAEKAGCDDGTGTCSVTPSTVLASGGGKWWIQTWNTAGYGPWSSSKSFNLDTSSGGKPGSATLISPSGTISDSTPAYTWHAVSSATYYNLWVNDATGKKIEQWYTAEEAGCSGGTGTCSVTPSTVLTNGSGKWWIQTWNTAGYGPWSSSKSFNLDTSSGGKPGLVTLISPSGNTTSNPAYRWYEVTNATHYDVYVQDSAGRVLEGKQLEKDDICSGGTCTAFGPDLPMGDGIWWVRATNSKGKGPWGNGKTFTVY